MKEKHYKKTWLFTFTLMMVFTILFVGFGGMGISGMVDEAYAAAPGATTTSQIWDTNGTVNNAITIGGTNTEITINPGVEVTVADKIVIDGTVTIKGGGKLVRGSGFTGHMIWVNEGKALTVKAVTIDGGNNLETPLTGKALIANVGGTVNILDGAILQNNTTDTAGGGVWNGGTLNMSGGFIQNCTTSNFSNGGGGGVKNEGSCTFNMTGGTIQNCTAGSWGGGLSSTGTFDMSGGKIQNCTAGNGGGVYSDSSSTFNLSGNPDISGNLQMVSGAANEVCLGGIPIKVTGIMSNTTSIGISVDDLASEPIVVTGSEAYVTAGSLFHSDNSTYVLTYSTDGTVGSLKLEDTIAPTISSSTAVAANNAYIDVTFSEAVRGANDHTTLIDASKLLVNFLKNVGGTATGASITSITKTTGGALDGTETTVRFNLSITGTPNGLEAIEIMPADGASVYDIAGNAMLVTQTGGVKNLNGPPAITSATYNASTGVLTVTGTNMITGDTIDVSKLTITGEGGLSYTLTSSNTTAASATQFSVTLNATDQAAVNQILNKNGISSSDGTTYNISAAEDWATGADPAVVVADQADNGITVSNAVIKETTPTAGFEASTMTLSNVTSAMKYSVDGSNWNAITGTSIVISDVTTANGIKVYTPGNGTTTTDSEVQVITISQATTPTAAAFTVTQPSTIGGIGSIAGITNAMAYSTDSGSTWTTGGSTLSDIAGGTTYVIRVKASGTVLASENYSITINAFNATQLSTPTGLAWDNATPGKATWAVVSEVSSYSIQLYKGGTEQGSAVTGITNTYYDFTSAITAAGTGSYTFKVTAIGDGVTYSSSTQSAESVAYSYTAAVNASILPITATFDKKTSAQADVPITLTLNGNILSSIVNGTTALTQVTDYTVSGTTVTILKAYLANQATGAVTLTFNFSAGNSQTLVITVSNSTSSGGSGGGGGSSSSSNSTTTTTPTPSDGASVIVNGETQTAGTSATSTVSGQTTTTVTVDSTKLAKMLEKKGTNATVTIPLTTGSDVVAGVLTGQAIKNMETKDATLEIKTENVTYTLPAGQINIDNVSAQMGQGVELNDIKVNISISQSPQNTVKIVADTANKNHYQVVVKPVEFNISCTSGDKTVEVSKFNGYVERTVAIPEGIDPSKITTGIILNNDGTFSHVPTTIVKIDAKHYARINSLTNSTYSLIYNPKTFTDVAQHWGKTYVNEMGSRLVVSGIDASNFAPDRDITRAEFAAIVVRALGLTEDNKSKLFNDVKDSDWFSGSVAKANEYGIVSGMGDGRFMPNKAISRQEAMVMIAKAMKIAKMNTTLNEVDITTQLNRFNDSNRVSVWAKNSTATCIKLGVMEGSNGSLRPQSNITRAETATVVMKMLKQAGLI